MKRLTKRFLYAGLIILLTGIAGCGTVGYYIMFLPNFTPPETKYIYIHEDARDFQSLCATLRDSAGCKHLKSFEILASLRKYPENIKSGKYAVDPNMNNNTLINSLRRGQQTPVRLTFNNIRLISDLTTRLSDQLMIDNDDLLLLLGDEAYCRSLGFDIMTIKAMFIPNTYEVYWNISAEKLMERMKREYDTFWNGERREKAENIGLSPIDVSILASIVEEESAVADEYPVVAGVYINRLQRGMLLQADPTVKYAVGDFTLQRILNIHLQEDSPYNTYMYPGLPPGPIRIPSIQAINGVLHYTRHNYIYMCAKEDFSGRHNFAVTLAEHSRNAARYHAELNKRGIR